MGRARGLSLGSSKTRFDEVLGSGRGRERDGESLSLANKYGIAVLSFLEAVAFDGQNVQVLISPVTDDDECSSVLVLDGVPLAYYESNQDRVWRDPLFRGTPRQQIVLQDLQAKIGARQLQEGKMSHISLNKLAEAHGFSETHGF